MLPYFRGRDHELEEARHRARRRRLGRDLHLPLSRVAKPGRAARRARSAGRRTRPRHPARCVSGARSDRRCRPDPQGPLCALADRAGNRRRRRRACIA